MFEAHGRWHVDNSINELGVFQVRQIFPTAQKLRHIHPLARYEFRWPDDGGQYGDVPSVLSVPWAGRTQSHRCAFRRPRNSATPRVCLHLVPENLIDIGLIPPSAAAKPCEDICVNTNTDVLLDGAVKTSDVKFRRRRLPLRRIGEINLRIGLTREFPEFTALLPGERSRKDRARGNSLF